MLDIDRTFRWGRLYLDISGSFPQPMCRLGISVAAFPASIWDRHVSLHLLFWCISIGWDAAQE